MHKPTETTINLFIDKLNNNGVGVSLMKNEDIDYIVDTIKSIFNSRKEI